MPIGCCSIAVRRRRTDWFTLSGPEARVTTCMDRPCLARGFD
jgi:hypothetical protein